MDFSWIDLLGWLGSLAILSAFALLSAEKIGPKSAEYLWMNLVGSFFLIVNTYVYNALPATFLNVVWLGIAFVGLTKRRKND